jgi:two-component system, NarL family, nitrate/nitrite response regulator NarL
VKRKTRIAIVDDHELMRRGLRETLSECAEFQVVGEGGTVEEALQLVKDLAPDIILLDVNMPGNGISVVRQLDSFVTKPKAIMFTVYEDLANVRECMSSGAYGYILKGVASDELISIIKMVERGKKYVCPELAAKFLSAPAHGKNDKLVPGATTLTQRELQILDLIARGESNSAISKNLKLSEATVKHYITPLFRKLGVRNRTEAALKSLGITEQQ